MMVSFPYLSMFASTSNPAGQFHNGSLMSLPGPEGRDVRCIGSACYWNEYAKHVMTFRARLHWNPFAVHASSHHSPSENLPETQTFPWTDEYNCHPGYDSWSMLSGVLELLQWKTDVKDSERLLAPLSQVLKFLLQQLKGIHNSRESEVIQDRDNDGSQEDARWSAVLKTFVLQACLMDLLLHTF